jgi:glutamine synthetase
MSGFVRRHRLREGGGEDAAAAVLRWAEEAGLETVRISFADQHGILRGKTLMIDGLKNALDNGGAMTSTLLLKDTSHETVYPVWQEDIGFGRGCLTGAGDVLMIPRIPRPSTSSPGRPRAAGCWPICT